MDDRHDYEGELRQELTDDVAEDPYDTIIVEPSMLSVPVWQWIRHYLFDEPMMSC